MLEGRPLTESLKAGKSGALGFLEKKKGQRRFTWSQGSSRAKVQAEAKLDQLTRRQG